LVFDKISASNSKKISWTTPELTVNPLTHWGRGAYWLPSFESPVAQKVMKLNKFGKISYSPEVILALKLSSGVSSKKAILYK
jgi:hypothetical protein